MKEIQIKLLLTRFYPGKYEVVAHSMLALETKGGVVEGSIDASVG